MKHWRKNFKLLYKGKKNFEILLQCNTPDVVENGGQFVVRSGQDWFKKSDLLKEMKQ